MMLTFYEVIVMKFEYIKKINTSINYFVLFIGIIFFAATGGITVNYDKSHKYWIS